MQYYRAAVTIAVRYVQFMRLLLSLALVVLAAVVYGRQMTEAEKQAVLDAHNTARSRVDPPAKSMPQMVWDANVEAVAQRWADTCPDGHNPNRGAWYADGDQLGENLAWGYMSFGAAVEGWENEKKDYSLADGCIRNRVCGHYTQIVWADSIKLGCATPTRDDCPSWGGNRYYVCNYAPPGNFVGQKPYEAADTIDDKGGDGTSAALAVGAAVGAIALGTAIVTIVFIARRRRAAKQTIAL